VGAATVLSNGVWCDFSDALKNTCQWKPSSATLLMAKERGKGMARNEVDKMELQQIFG
jgi:hypothetical protein